MRILVAMVWVFVLQFCVVLLVCSGVVAVWMKVPELGMLLIWGVAGVSYIVAQVCITYGVRIAVGGAK
jgi:hypothetical protein